MPDYYSIGKFAAVHGLKGELVLQHTLGKKTSLKGLEVIFTEEKKGAFLPWFIQETRIKSETEIYLLLDGVHTREEAQQLTQKAVWLREAEFTRYAAKSAPINLLGYTLKEGTSELGEILEVIEQPHQLLCRLEIQGKEVLIPLHENSLERIDHRKKEVRVSLPEGLLDIYLG